MVKIQPEDEHKVSIPYRHIKNFEYIHIFDDIF